MESRYIGRICPFIRLHGTSVREVKHFFYRKKQANWAMRVELKDASRILGQFRKSQNISWSCLLDINTWPCWLPPSPARAPPPAACASILVCASRPGRPASFNNATCPLRRTTGPAHRPITCYEAMGRNLKSAGIWPERTAARSP